jgi:hypothetical protein
MDMEQDQGICMSGNGNRLREKTNVRVWVDHLPEAREVSMTQDELWISLADGRRLGIPLHWFPWLSRASHRQRRNWELVGNGIGINWPDLRQEIFVLDLCVPPATRAGDQAG